jgi:diacylglycerol kinase family enzyme
MSGLAVLANPRSKSGLADPRRPERLAHVLAGRGQVHAPSSREALDEVCAALAAEGVDTVAIHGGDGTLHVTLTALCRAYADAPPRVAILPAGTLNTVATGLRLLGEPLELLDRLAAGHERGALQTFTRPLLRVGPHVGFLFGQGLVARFMDAYYATGAPSPATGAWLLARAAGSALWRGPFARGLFSPTPCAVEVDGARWPRDDSATVLAATVPEIGLGFAPGPRALERDDAFQIVGLHASPAQVVGLLPRIRLGRALPPERASSAMAGRAVLHGAGRWPYVVDGDVHHAEGALELAVGPRVALWRPGF